MTPRELQYKSASLRMGTYRGSEAPAVFTSVADEFQALRSGAGLYEAAWEAKLLCTGSDRLRWLNGMVTNNVRDLAVDRGVYAFVLNAQGHAQGDVNVFNRGKYLLLTTTAAQAAKLSEWFERYIIMDDVEIANVTEKLGTLGIVGPHAGDVLAKAGLPVPDEPMQVADTTWQAMGVSVIRGHDQGALWFEVLASPENLQAISERLLAAGARQIGYEALELHRVACGIPAFGQDIRERELPQETGQSHALHFAKGCYIGQEIVERIRSRGNVHRGFAGFRLSESVQPGTKLQRDGKEIGELTSVATLPAEAGGAVLALGYVRREAAAPGTELSADTARATVQKLPFEI